MKEFMDKDFLLSTQTAQVLYHEYAAAVPVVDYHCHINPKEIAENRSFDNITQAWLAGDHYKWRLMRTFGVDERYITGDAEDYEKFLAFATMLPQAIGNPMYHWCHLELQRYFECDLPLNEKTASQIWEHCNKKLAKGLRVRDIILQSRVTTIVTTDDPVDSLEHHVSLAKDADFPVKVLPAWRPDKAINIDKKEFTDYMAALAEASGVRINSLESLENALLSRMEHFESCGCRASDHGIHRIVRVPASRKQLEDIFRRRMAGEVLAPEEVHAFQYAMLLFCGRQYAKRGWVMEVHFGVLRNVNSVRYQQLGPDTGFDCIDSSNCMGDLAEFMDELNAGGELPKTILFSIKPADNAAISSAIGCFQEKGIAAKVQHGSAWWFNDTRHGMEQQMENLASMSLLGAFIGMLTDSRSFLSYTRHEYFRRILCNMIGNWVENGEYPQEYETLGRMVQDISYNNAMKYFGF